MSDDKDPAQSNDQLDKLKEKIVADYPRLGLDDNFQFGCHPGV